MTDRIEGGGDISSSSGFGARMRRERKLGRSVLEIEHHVDPDELLDSHEDRELPYPEDEDTEVTIDGPGHGEVE